MRMDALNRHLKSETGVECARVVERGKGSGSGGGVLVDLDSSGYNDRLVVVVVWIICLGRHVDQCFQSQISSVASHCLTRPRERRLSFFI